MKYIDADKVKSMLRERYNAYKIEQHSPFRSGKVETLRETIELINSLQQEQESVAERFARIVRGNLIGIDKEVQQKFEQLYFEITGNKMYGGYND